MSAVPLTLVKQFLNLDNSTHDDELVDMVDRAEAVIARRVGPLEPVLVADEVHTGPAPIALDRWPIVSVTSATTDGAVVTDLDADLVTGVVYGTFGRAARGVRVTYVAGRAAPLPADLEAAVLELVRHLWESQRVAGATRPGFQGYGGGTGDAEPPPGMGYLLPYRVQSLLEPYMIPGVA